jgi:hypothetical protein
LYIDEQPFATLLQMYQRLSATFLQICYRMSEDIGNPLANLLFGVREYGIGNFLISSSEGIGLLDVLSKAR